MSRYIDVDIAKNLILNDMALAEREGKDLIGYTDALFHLKTIPIADVVEVVRCKDCKHWCNDGYDTITNRRFGSCTCEYWEHPTEYFETAENDYCSYGERSENGKRKDN